MRQSPRPLVWVGQFERKRCWFHPIVRVQFCRWVLQTVPDESRVPIESLLWCAMSCAVDVQPAVGYGSAMLDHRAFVNDHDRIISLLKSRGVEQALLAEITQVVQERSSSIQNAEKLLHQDG